MTNNEMEKYRKAMIDYIKESIYDIIVKGYEITEMDRTLYEDGYIDDSEKFEHIILINKKGEKERINSFDYMVQLCHISTVARHIVALTCLLNNMFYKLWVDETPAIIDDFVDDAISLYTKVHNKDGYHYEEFEDILFKCLEVVAIACSEMDADEVGEKIYTAEANAGYLDKSNISGDRLDYQREVEEEIYKSYIDKYKSILKEFEDEMYNMQ